MAARQGRDGAAVARGGRAGGGGRGNPALNGYAAETQYADGPIVCRRRSMQIEVIMSGNLLYKNRLNYVSRMLRKMDFSNIYFKMYILIGYQAVDYFRHFLLFPQDTYETRDIAVV